jgi:multiple sugar transport system permease protein
MTVRKSILRNTVIYSIIALVLFVSAAPYIWLIATSLKVRADIFTIPPVWIFRPTLNSYKVVFIEKGFIFTLRNSIIVALGTTAFSLAVGVPAAYSFSRYKMTGGSYLTFLILFTYMCPPIVLAVPFFILFKTLGLFDTPLALIIAYTTFNLAFVVWIMKGFFDEVPKSIDQSALVDGCTPFAAFRDVVLPLVAPGMAATSIFCFLASWNEFLYALTLTAYHSKTLPVAIPGLVTVRGTFWNEIGAVAVTITILALIFAFVVQKHLVRGLTFGAVKG